MADDPNKSKEVDMNSPLIPQRKRMAAGKKVDGQHLPGNKAESKPVPKPKA
jgi:hypothetical protein